MQILHDSLPPESRAKLLLNKKVTTVSTTPSGVSVTCAGGAHSTVRSQMCTIAASSSSSPLARNLINPENPFLTSYRSMWIRFPTLPPITPGDASETHGYNCTLQLFARKDTFMISIYERLDTPTRDGVRYSPQDEQLFVEKWGHLPVIADGPTIAEAYTNRTQAGMVNLKEGVLKHWYHDRVSSRETRRTSSRPRRGRGATMVSLTSWPWRTSCIMRSGP